MKYLYCLDCGAVHSANIKKCMHGCGETLIENKTKGTLYVEWGPTYTPVSDFAIDESYELLLDSTRRQFATPMNHLVYKAGFSTGNIFTRIRLGVAKKEIEFPVIFVYRGHEMPLNKYGSSINWVEGFTEYTAHLSQLLMEEVISIRREEKKKKKHFVSVNTAINLLFPTADVWGTDTDYIKYVKSKPRFFSLQGKKYRMYYNKKEGFYYKYLDDSNG